MLFRNVRFFVGIGILFSVFILSGCATIVTGRSQNVTVETEPSGANVTIDGSVQVTPATFILKKKGKSYKAKIEKDGYMPQEVELKKGLSGWFFGNILLGGVIGIAIDLGTGSMYKISPAKISLSLEPDANFVASPKSSEMQIDQRSASKCEGIDVNSKEWSSCMGIN